MPRPGGYWLVKTEPECFSIQHLAACPKGTTSWSGVRNYQARNFIRDGMKLGDRVLFYHSSADPPAVAGTAVVVREAYPDPTALDRRDQHYDPKATSDNPIWVTVDIQLERIFPTPVPIGALRGVVALRDLELLRKGSRLSIQPVTAREFEIVEDMGLAAYQSKQPAKAKNLTAKKAKRVPANSSLTKHKKAAGRR